MYCALSKTKKDASCQLLAPKLVQVKQLLKAT